MSEQHLTSPCVGLTGHLAMGISRNVRISSSAGMTGGCRTYLLRHVLFMP